MSFISEKVAYLGGLADGLKLKDEGTDKVLRGIIDRREDTDIQPPTRAVAFQDLQVGQRLAENVETLEAWLVLPCNTVIGRTHLEKMRNFHRLAGLKEPVLVFDE